LAALSIQSEPAGIREALVDFIKEDAAMFFAAFDNETQTLGQWCDPEFRADEIAKTLTTLIRR
jgi:hypothetical protein